MRKLQMGGLVAAVLLLGFAAFPSSPSRSNAADKATAPADKAAVERTRKQVRMLDDLYKTAIVLVTEHCVQDETSLAAGSAFEKLFETMKEKGWHEVRLVDATNNPVDDDNLPNGDFEKSAIKQLRDGKTFVDEVFSKDGKNYLRAATPIPVVMEKCILCHAHYKDVPKGQIIGAVSYVIPVE